jgi:hypothetical protein
METHDGNAGNAGKRWSEMDIMDLRQSIKTAIPRRRRRNSSAAPWARFARKRRSLGCRSAEHEIRNPRPHDARQRRSGHRVVPRLPQPGRARPRRNGGAVRRRDARPGLAQAPCVLKLRQPAGRFRRYRPAAVGPEPPAPSPSRGRSAAEHRLPDRRPREGEQRYPGEQGCAHPGETDQPKGPAGWRRLS